MGANLEDSSATGVDGNQRLRGIPRRAASEQTGSSKTLTTRIRTSRGLGSANVSSAMSTRKLALFASACHSLS